MKYLSFVLLLCFLSACGELPQIKRKLVSSESLVTKGAALSHVAACGSCHLGNQGSSLSGGKVVFDRYGEIRASNITPGRTGIKGWTLSDFITVMRTGERPNESKISSDFHRAIAWASDADLRAVFAYLKAQKPVKNYVPERKLTFLQRYTTGLADSREKVVGYVPQPLPSEYGEYLFKQFADCSGCHTAKPKMFAKAEPLKGGKSILTEQGLKISPTLIGKNRLSDWSKTQIRRYLKYGETPKGEIVNENFCPIEEYSKIPDPTLSPLVEYLYTLKTPKK